jgi:uncharacterized repeat protein (TIGR01451 family)
MGAPCPLFSKVPKMFKPKLLSLTIFLLFAVFLFPIRVTFAQGPVDRPIASAPSEPAINPTLRAKIEPQLAKALLSSNGQPVPFIVHLVAQPDVEGAITAATAGIGAQQQPDPLIKRQAIVQELQKTARQTQSGILRQLNNPGGISGQAATDIRSLWIINAVAASGSLGTVTALAARPDVKIIRLDKTIQLNSPPDSASETIPHRQTTEWGVRKIRADLVHNALGFNGSGIVIANVDSGVDWLHPDLQNQYRGFTGVGKLPNHTGNWVDTTGGNATYPVDGQGHGTHTMGTAVGANGIGVAPGAQWIAARAFDSDGFAQDSWLHAALQWILAPNNNPALAPHIVNNSWSNNNSYNTEFKPDIELLQSAGIFVVFSAGNNGSSPGSVGAPGSNQGVFSVGATDIDDNIAGYSGRGPSPWGDTKPEVSAPGTNVRSTLPGGAYGSRSGTSMAAPHVSGLAALMLQASPSLSTNLTLLAETLKSTAVALPEGGTVPNNDYGWGRVDAYNAVLSVAPVGTLSGAITALDTASAVEDAVVEVTPVLSGPVVNTTSNSKGEYVLGLAPGTYDVTATAFGYESLTENLVWIVTGTNVVQNFALSPKPTGFLSGTVTALISGLPLSATIKIEGTSVATTTLNGQYALTLPIGVYTVTAIAAGHRISSATGVTVTTSLTTSVDFALEAAPSILIVDSGAWYDTSQLFYFGQVLTDLRYPYDTWQITSPFFAPIDTPSATTLSQYDLVIWSSPEDSPGYIDANQVLEDYLDSGGRLLITGQDIGYFDGGGYNGGVSALFKNYLKAKYLQDTADANFITGSDGEPFAGLSFSFNNAGGAENQTTPDIIDIEDPDYTHRLLQYGDSSDLAAIYTGLYCLPYRTVYFSFGFEGIGDRATRQQVMQQAIDLLTQPAPETGIELTSAESRIIGNFGQTISHTVRLRNIGTSADTITLTNISTGPYYWETNTLPPQVTLSTCELQQLDFAVRIPVTPTWHITDSSRLMAQSGNTPMLTDVITIHTKSPAPVLLVDDDRFYSFAALYQQTLSDANILYDFYSVPKSYSGGQPDSPTLSMLEMYPMVIWYTAYDWVNVLTPLEEYRLESYLNGGGRLFFSSQEFLRDHLDNHNGEYQPFATDYLGVEVHTEDYYSTEIHGQRDNPVGAYLGPSSLIFPPGYRNYTDALTPTTAAQVATTGQWAQPNSLTNRGNAGPNVWHTNFLAFGPEVMPMADRIALIQRSVGWLSWLGDSSIQPEATIIQNGTLITYNVSLKNDGWGNIASAQFTATLPAYLTPVSASGGVTLQDDEFLWSGPLAAGSNHSLTFTAQINQPLTAGTVISQTNWLAYNEHTVKFDRITTMDVGPDLNNSAMVVTPTHNIAQYDILTYTITVENQGTVDSPVVTTTNTLPAVMELMTVELPSAGQVQSHGNHLTWTTGLSINQVATVTFMAKVTGEGPGVIANVAQVDDGVYPLITLTAESRFALRSTFLPVVVKDD